MISLGHDKHGSEHNIVIRSTKFEQKKKTYHSIKILQGMSDDLELSVTVRYIFRVAFVLLKTSVIIHRKNEKKEFFFLVYGIKYQISLNKQWNWNTRRIRFFFEWFCGKNKYK